VAQVSVERPQEIAGVHTNKHTRIMGSGCSTSRGRDSKTRKKRSAHLVFSSRRSSVGEDEK